VVRPAPDLPDALFLGYLVEYLQDHFDLPPNANGLQKVSTDDDDDDDTPRKTNRYIVSFDSSMPSAEATRMDIEVVGIFTDETATKRIVVVISCPSMAMVVVHKDPNSGCVEKLPPILQNLFADSEKRILKALDRAGRFRGRKSQVYFRQTDPKLRRRSRHRGHASGMDEDDDMDRSKAGQEVSQTT
jgi:hypothetical protein